MNRILYGYDGYEVSYIDSSAFTREDPDFHLNWYWNPIIYENETMIPIDDYDTAPLQKMDEHPELLESAQKVFVHSCSDLPRDLVRRKYKRVLNPWLADVVVMPDPVKYQEKWLAPVQEDCVLFVNEQAKKAIYSKFYYHWDPSRSVTEKFKNISIGTRLVNCMPAVSRSGMLASNADIANAQLVYKGNMASFYNKDKATLEYFLGELPANKVVFQSTILKTLGDNDNKPTVETLLSIHELLKSKDDENVALGLKTAAAMDYANYKQSFRIILRDTVSYWRYCNARNASAVKVMLRTLDLKSRGSYYYSRDTTIIQEDFELYQSVVRKIFDYTDEGFLRHCTYQKFLYIDDNFIVHPRTPQPTVVNPLET